MTYMYDIQILPKVLLNIFGNILLEGFAIEYLNVFCQADIEAAYAFHAADGGGKVPDVLIVFVACDKILGTGVFFYQQVLSHQVELEGNGG